MFAALVWSAAEDVEALVMNSAQQVVEAREATKRTTSELAHADAENQHLHKPAVIGRMGEKNFIWPVGASPTLIAPEPWNQWLTQSAEAAPHKAA